MPSVFRFGDVEVDPACFSVARAGRRLPLEPKAVTLLLLLLEHRHRVVTKDEIVEHLWKDTFVTPNALTRLVAQLRRELGDAAHEASVIQTVHRRGYRFVATLNDEAAASRTENHLAADVERKAGIRPLRTSWVRAAGAAAIAACLVWVAVRAMRPSVEGVVWNRLPSPEQVTASLGLDSDPTLSPDGQLLAWSSDQSGQSEIYLQDRRTAGVERQITQDGRQNVEPAVSPDGSWIAYRSRVSGGIWMVPTAGGTPRQVVAFGARPAWSPDGRRLVFGSSETLMAGQSRIWSIAPDGSALRPLTEASRPAGVHLWPRWSPDGRRLAFVAGGVGDQTLWLQETEGRRLTRVRDAHAFAGVGFSGSGDVLWAEGSQGAPGRVWRQQLDQATGSTAGAPVIIPTPGDGIRTAVGFGHDSLAWVATRVAMNLWSLPITAGAPAGDARPLTRTTYRNSFPMFSPDGSRIAFQRKRPGMDAEVWTIPADGGTPTPLVPANSQGFFPHWLPGGERVLAVERTTRGLQFAYLDVRSGRRDAVRAIDREQHPRLSPDGRRVAFHSPVGGVLQVFVAPVTGGASTQLTFSPNDTAYPSWSPDGRHLAVEIRSGEDVHVGVMSASGGPARQITSGRGLNWPHSWAPDNDRIAFAGERGGTWNLYSVSASTGEVRQLTAWAGNGYLRYPAWSPRDTSIVFERAEVRGNIWTARLP